MEQIWKGAEIGSKFFWKQIFLRKFGEQIFFASKISFWEEKNTGEQKCYGEERYGEQKNSGSKKIWRAKKFGGGGGRGRGGGGECKQNLGNKNLLG